MNNSAEVIKMLKAVGLEAHKMLEKTPQLQLVTKHGIQSIIMKLQPSAGTAIEGNSPAVAAAGKPTSIAGRKINWERGSDAAAKGKLPKTAAVEELESKGYDMGQMLSNQVEDAYQEFIGPSSSESIKKTLPDVMIRAVAAKVGFEQITATEPKTIPLRLVAEIKAKALEMQEAIDANNKAMGTATTGIEPEATTEE